MMGWKIVLKTGGEHDVVSSWRRRHAYLTRAGATNKIKTGIRRRARHTIRLQLHTGDFHSV